MESYTDEFGTVHDDPNYYYLGFIITMDAKQPLRQQVADRYISEYIAQKYDQRGGVAYVFCRFGTFFCI